MLIIVIRSISMIDALCQVIELAKAVRFFPFTRR